MCHTALVIISEDCLLQGEVKQKLCGAGLNCSLDLSVLRRATAAAIQKKNSQTYI